MTLAAKRAVEQFASKKGMTEQSVASRVYEKFGHLNDAGKCVWTDIAPEGAEDALIKMLIAELRAARRKRRNR